MIRFNHAVKNYKPPLTIQPANSVPRIQSNISCLIPYIRKGRAMRLEQSIMYKTPRKQQGADECKIENELKMRTLSSVRQHLFSRDSFVLGSDIDLVEESVDLTSILEKISSLSTTLTSTVSNTLLNQPTDQDAEKVHMKAASNHVEGFSDKVKVLPGICLSNSNQISISATSDGCSIIGGGDAPSAIETPERYEDMQRLEKRIKALQKQISEESKD